MKTDSTDVKSPGHAPPTSRPAHSPLRLIVLLGVLVVVVAVLLYDRVIAPPQVYAANEKLHDTILKHNANGLISSVTEDANKEASAAAKEVGGLLYSEDIQKILGRAPTKVEKTEYYTLEHYCWWGWIPRDRNYITVLYVGNPDRRHYSTHTANAIPDDALLPDKLEHDETPIDLTSEPSSATAIIPTRPPAGMGPGAGGGNAKGRPQGKANDNGNESKESEEGKTKVDESQKTGEPAKSAAPPKEPDAAGEKKAPSQETKDAAK